VTMKILFSLCKLPCRRQARKFILTFHPVHMPNYMYASLCIARYDWLTQHFELLMFMLFKLNLHIKHMLSSFLFFSIEVCYFCSDQATGIHCIIRLPKHLVVLVYSSAYNLGHQCDHQGVNQSFEQHR